MSRSFALALLLALAALEVHAAEVFNESDFSTWSFGAVSTNGTPGTNTYAQRDGTGGNPGAKMVVLTYGSAGPPVAYGYKSDYATTAALEGTSFALTLDIQANWSQSVELVVEQGGTVYRRKVGDTVAGSVYVTTVFNGTLAAAAFTKVSGTGPAQPNFAGGVSTRFGIAGVGTAPGASVTVYHDNVRLDLGAIGGSDPCAGYTDIAQDASFCQATIWLRNRGITTGCAPNQYCPGFAVTRAQMALFLNRLGKALAPEVLHDARSHPSPVLAIDPNPGSLLCETQDFATGSYSRIASFYGHFAAYPFMQTISVQGYLRYSANGGQTWNYVGNWNVNQFPAVAVANPGQVASGVVNAPPLNLVPNTSYRFGLFADSMGTSPGITAIACNVQVTILTPP